MTVIKISRSSIILAVVMLAYIAWSQVALYLKEEALAIEKARVLSIALALMGCSILSGCSKPEPSVGTSYAKNGFSMLLPKDWAVLQDNFPEATQRLITISTSIGSRVSIDIFDTRASRPNLELFLQQHMSDAIPTSDRDSVKISYGEVTRQQGQGYFVEVRLDDEFNTAFYIEIVEMMYEDHQSYVTLHTPMESKDKVLVEFNQFIENIN